MKWIKKGLIFNANQQVPHLISYATVPIAEKIDNSIYRIYFSSRDETNHSHTFFIEIDIHNPKKIIRISEKPILSPGKLGSFDDSGAMASWIVNVNQKKYLYYIGWNERVTIPYHNSIGLAISSDNGKTFKKYADGPIVDRTPNEPYFSASCCSLIENNVWKLWYLSCKNWLHYNGNARPNYHIKYAESDDGINWKRNGHVSIDFKNDEEWAISRPSIIKENGLYKMWYSFSGDLSYRIGYAESQDGKNWKRMDDLVGITISSSGWDSQSIEYPFVFEHDRTKYMLYCGNEFGKTGFGYAIME